MDDVGMECGQERSPAAGTLPEVLRGLLEPHVFSEDCLFLWCSESCSVAYANRACEQLFGYESGAMEGMPLCRLFAPEERQALCGLFCSGTPLLREGHRFVTKEGQLLDLLSTRTSFCADGRPSHRRNRVRRWQLVRLVDVTHLRNRERALGKEIGVLSHDLRSSLNATIGFSEMLIYAFDALELKKRELLGDDFIRMTEWADCIKKSGHTMLGLVDTVADLQKIGDAADLCVEVLNLATLAEDCVTAHTFEADARGVVLHVDVPGNVRLRGDLVRVKQILWNLVGNAIKYNRPENGQVWIRVTVSGGCVELVVRDTGIGIFDSGMVFGHLKREDYRPEVAEAPGQGIGLALVKSVVAKHGGRIAVHSDGDGSEFTVTFPPNRTIAG